MAGLAETKLGKLVRHAIGAALSPVHAGDEKIVLKEPGTFAAHKLMVFSDAFKNGHGIPLKYSPGSDNISPQLMWSGVPEGAKELVLIVQDPDAPFPNPFVHWILHGLPASTAGLPAGVPTVPIVDSLGGARQGQNDMKKPGYYGPEPPLGHGVHHYHFQLFALDTQLNAPPDTPLEDLVKKMEDHVLAEGELVGTYERRGT